MQRCGNSDNKNILVNVCCPINTPGYTLDISFKTSQYELFSYYISILKAVDYQNTNASYLNDKDIGDFHQFLSYVQCIIAEQKQPFHGLLGDSVSVNQLRRIHSTPSGSLPISGGAINV